MSPIPVHRSAAVRLAGLGVAGALLLSGCAESPLPSAPGTVDSGVASSPRLGPLPTPAPSLTEERTRGLESTPWRLERVEGRDVTIRFIAGGGCSAFEGVRVHQRAEDVEIWTAVKTDHGPQACAAYLAFGATTLHLAAPLGGRALVHAPISDDWKTYVDQF